MVLFESTLTLLLIAIVLLQISRRWPVPYPAMLALAGVAVAALPWTPAIDIDPPLALALFIAPALLDAAYDFAPRALKRYWLSVFSLAAIAVVLTTAAVAWVGVAFGGLPLAAAIALGAIVAPPDAAAASAVLGRFDLPRTTVAVLKGESLLNDAVALLIFSVAVGAASSSGGTNLPTSLWFAVPGGVVVGVLLGRLRVALSRPLDGTLSGTLAEFVATFGAWLIADRLHLSAILSVVAFGMTVAHYMPERQSARDRVHSYSVWRTAVFVLNVIAFMLIGLQARDILSRLEPEALWQALGFAGIVLAAVVLVRMAWVLLYNRVLHVFKVKQGGGHPPSLAQGVLAGWCGMRGLVTLATALALPPRFPGRDVIVLSALTVVLGTLILQGLTLAPLIRWLRFSPDDAFDKELVFARLALNDAGLASLGDDPSEDARKMRRSYESDRESIDRGQHPREGSGVHDLHRDAIAAKRVRLAELRHAGKIEDDVFHALEEELDWAELAASPPERFELLES